MTTSASDSIVRRGDVLWRSVIDGVLIRRRGDDEELLLTGTGVALWAELATAVPVGELIGRLAEAHGTTPEVVVADVEPVLEDLVARAVLIRG